MRFCERDETGVNPVLPYSIGVPAPVDLPGYGVKYSGVDAYISVTERIAVQWLTCLFFHG